MEPHCLVVCCQGAADWPTIVHRKKFQMLDYPDPDPSLANACAERARYRSTLSQWTCSEYGYTYQATIAQYCARYCRHLAGLRLYLDTVQACVPFLLESVYANAAQ